MFSVHRGDPLPRDLAPSSSYGVAERPAENVVAHEASAPDASPPARTSPGWVQTLYRKLILEPGAREYDKDYYLFWNTAYQSILSLAALSNAVARQLVDCFEQDLRSNLPAPVDMSNATDPAVIRFKERTAERTRVWTNFRNVIVVRLQAIATLADEKKFGTNDRFKIADRFWRSATEKARFNAIAAHAQTILNTPIGNHVSAAGRPIQFRHLGTQTGYESTEPFSARDRTQILRLLYEAAFVATQMKIRLERFQLSDERFDASEAAIATAGGPVPTEKHSVSGKRIALGDIKGTDALHYVGEHGTRAEVLGEMKRQARKKVSFGPRASSPAQRADTSASAAQGNNSALPQLPASTESLFDVERAFQEIRIAIDAAPPSG